jgi:hypothetical protein
LVGVVEVTGVEVAGVADAEAEVTHVQAVAEVAVDLEAVADVRGPGADVEAAGFVVEAAARGRHLLQDAAEVVFARPADVGRCLCVGGGARRQQ